MIRVVVFDLDDTLYPEHKYVDSGFRAVDQYLSSEYKADGFYEIAQKLFAQGNRGRIFNEALDVLEFSYQVEFINELVGVYRNHKPDINIAEDVSRALEYFSKNYKTALITDGYQVAQRNKIEALAISKYFDFICVTDEFGREYWKPHEKPFVAAENAFKVRSYECVYIADNPAKDFVTANHRGWITIQLLSDNGEYSSLAVGPKYQAQFQVTSLCEVLSHLANL